MAPGPDTVCVGEDKEAVLRGQRLRLGAAVALLPLLGLLLVVVHYNIYIYILIVYI